MTNKKEFFKEGFFDRFFKDWGMKFCIGFLVTVLVALALTMLIGIIISLGFISTMLIVIGFAICYFVGHLLIEGGL